MITPTNELKELVLEKLKKELPKGLFYHAPEHTLDVFNHAIEIAQKENLSSEEINLVGIAALFHDTGYILGSKNHEIRSCKIAQSILIKHGYKEKEIEQICKLIMATKIPQTPNNKQAMVLCDADLDYLGRDDFFILSEKLYREMVFFGAINSEMEWQQLQVNFLKAHHYFTGTERLLREKMKQTHLALLIKKYDL